MQRRRIVVEFILATIFISASITGAIYLRDNVWFPKVETPITYTGSYDADCDTDIDKFIQDHTTRKELIRVCYNSKLRAEAQARQTERLAAQLNEQSQKEEAKNKHLETVKQLNKALDVWLKDNKELVGKKYLIWRNKDNYDSETDLIKEDIFYELGVYRDNKPSIQLRCTTELCIRRWHAP